MEGLTHSYFIFERNGLKIGIIGLMTDPKGLISEENYQGMKWFDPIQSANRTAKYLKEQEHCNLVICLSHLGTNDDTIKRTIGDYTLARKSRNIEIILSGHDHRLVYAGERTNSDKKQCLLTIKVLKKLKWVD